MPTRPATHPATYPLISTNPPTTNPPTHQPNHPPPHSFVLMPSCSRPRQGGRMLERSKTKLFFFFWYLRRHFYLLKNSQVCSKVLNVANTGLPFALRIQTAVSSAQMRYKAYGKGSLLVSYQMRYDDKNRASTHTISSGQVSTHQFCLNSSTAAAAYRTPTRPNIESHEQYERPLLPHLAPRPLALK